MKRILLCTILRDAASHIETWYHHLCQLTKALEGHYVTELSTYANDSTDGTEAWLRERRENWAGAPRPFGRMERWHLRTEKLGTQRYGSIWSVDRLRNLANARQACLDQAGDLSRFDKIAFIEPDVTYDPHWAVELILARHPQQAGIVPDIYSGWSLRSLAHPKESVFLYDTCATRQTKDDTCWSFERESQWRGQSLVPTNLGGVDSNCLHSVYSTFNCFCVYNAKPFIEGVRWDYVNPRLDTGQQRVVRSVDGTFLEQPGWLDADTAVMCEAFRTRGYTGVYLNTNVLIRHA